MNKEYLNNMVASFVRRERQERLISLLGSKKRYDDFLEELLRDPRFFDPSSIVEIPSSEQIPSVIYQKMKAAGAGDPAYLVSTDLELDGLTMDLGSAIDKVACTGSETLILCLDPLIGYYEGHEGWRYLLRQSKDL